MDYLNTKRRGKKRAVARRALGVALLLFVAGALSGCRSIDWFLLKRTLRAKFSDVDWITTDELATWLNSEARPAPVLLDVRTTAEWQVSHLAGARRIDPQASAEEAGAGIAKDTPIVTYCAVGYRSGVVARRLRKAGYEHVQDLEGSIFEWANEGRPLVHDGAKVTKVHPVDATWGRLLRDEVRAPLPSPRPR
ncbi:MAG: rhodanese-like domain-containing protein [Chthoniobacterales bacterium]